MFFRKKMRKSWSQNFAYMPHNDFGKFVLYSGKKLAQEKLCHIFLHATQWRSLPWAVKPGNKICFQTGLSNSMSLSIQHSLDHSFTAQLVLYLTRHWLGDGRFTLPPRPGVSSIIPKLLQLATQNLVYLILHQFDIDGATFVKIC